MKIFMGVLITGILLLFGSGAAGQASDAEALNMEVEREADYFARSLDSLVNVWYVNASATNLVVDSIPMDSLLMLSDLPDSVYIQRLEAMVSPFEFSYNDKVKAYIRLYTQRRREQVEVMLGLAEYYFPIFETELDARGLPLELKYLPVIESALNPRALSRAGASGLWQFMYYTGKRYGLQVDSYTDERRDPVKSTRAAVSHLSDLYDIYGDWKLVIAAYNCGAGNVNRAIRRSGGKRDFWEIYYRLPRETRGYVPAFIAAAYTMTYNLEHSLIPRPVELPMATDTVMVSQPLHFSQVADVLNVPIEVIRDMNPQYRLDIIPAKTKSYPLRLAFDQSTLFASFEDSVFGFQREKYFPDNQLVVKPQLTQYPTAVPAGKDKVYYTVKSGDAIGLIAEWFDVYTSDLRYWNNIRHNLIKVGQKLVIYVPKGKADHYERIARAKSGRSSVASPADMVAASGGNDADFIYHTVGNGDSVWSIAREYPDVTDRDILRLNNISDSRKIKPGQRLKIKPKS